MAEQVDIAVDLGVLPPPLPEILNLRQLVEGMRCGTCLMVTRRPSAANVRVSARQRLVSP